MTRDSELELIRKQRCILENRIGAMLREFEAEFDVQVNGISFGAIEVAAIGSVVGHRHIQPRSMYECLIHLSV